MLGGRESPWSASPAPLRLPFWGPNFCQQGCAGAAMGTAISWLLLPGCFKPGGAQSGLLVAT